MEVDRTQGTLNFTDDGHAGAEGGQGYCFGEEALPSDDTVAEELTPVGDGEAVATDQETTECDTSAVLEINEENTGSVPKDKSHVESADSPSEILPVQRQRHRRSWPTSPRPPV